MTIKKEREMKIVSNLGQADDRRNPASREEGNRRRWGQRQHVDDDRIEEETGIN